MTRTDVLLLAVAVRLALDGGQRRPAFHLMSASIICLLVTDFVFGRTTAVLASAAVAVVLLTLWFVVPLSRYGRDAGSGD